LGFPYIFRGALDVRARTINEEMKLAAARALADLARQDVPDEVGDCEQGRQRLAFWPRLHHPIALRPAPDQLRSALCGASAAVDSGVARKSDRGP
jgi:malate dehydrogenase (oxaloacetate-decarboxylating)(NADP+)